MKIILQFVLFPLFFSTILLAQQAKNIEYDYTDGNRYTCKSNLYINGKESLFTFSDSRENGTNKNSTGVYKIYNDKWSRIFHTNGTLSLTRIPLYGKELIYQSSPGNIKMTEKTKVIEKYNCQEAIVSKGGRNYKVWFTSEVAISAGPMGINNLPGLVIELNEIDGENIKFKLSKISNLSDFEKFNTYKKYILDKKPLTYDNYKKDVSKVVTNKKRENNAILAENNATLDISEDQSFYTCHLIDVPENLVKDLQKIK